MVYNFAGKLLVFISLGLLGVGYLGVNLLEFEQGSILLIRLVVSIIIIFIIFTQGLKLVRLKPIAYIALLVFIIGCFTSLISLNLLFILIFIFATRELKVEFLLNSALYILGASVVLSLVMVYFGEIQNSFDIVGSAGDDGYLRERMTFGFKNVNAFSGLLTAFLLVFMTANKYIYIRYIVALLMAYEFYLYTDSRTMLVGLAGLVVFSLLFQLLRRHSRALFVLSIFFILSPVFITVFASTVIDYFPVFDTLLSLRLTFVSQYFSDIPFYVFLIGGGEPSSFVTVDNSFALMLGSIGFPLFLYFVYKFILRVRDCIVCMNLAMYSFLMSFWILSFSESSLVRPETLICLIFWFMLLVNDGKCKSDVR